MPTTAPIKILAILALIQATTNNIRVMSSVVALGAGVICNRIPGLTPRQREMCRAAPDAMVALGDGVRLGRLECQAQFKSHRWNCSALGKGNSFGHVILVGSKEAAFTYAVSSAGVAYSIAAACSRGNISTCGCAPGKAVSPPKWKWGGCSVDAGYGMRLARRFLDAREIEGDARSLMNLHNNKAGRKAVKASLQTECKCHGVSGSCTMKTCWKTLPPFRQIGDILMKKYWKARNVIAVPTTQEGGLKLILKRGSRTQGQGPEQQRPVAPRRSELVFLESSPNYCDRDPSTGSMGTQGRECNRTSKGMDGCDLMCCGRGYNTHQFTNTSQCHCKFHWCCYVRCDTCSEKTEQYTCK
ncbi:wnt oncogene analog 2 [Lycorma delicatula]|uniref:wnt oncogene analog 2 n=1 Tax=Lycorma delicatula TaxID=130591 RepID=UPI003F51958F